MMRLTGTLLFSLMCLIPLGVEGAVNKETLKTDCPTGSFFCSICGECKPNGSDCDSAHCSRKIKTIPLKKMPGTIYSLEEGAVVKCEGGKALVPVTSGTETHWTCGTSPGTSGKK